MPDELKFNEVAPRWPNAERPDIEMCEAGLTQCAPLGPIVLYDWRYDREGFEAAIELGKHLKQPGKKVAHMKFDADYFAELSVFVPPEVERAFRAGRPIVVEAIYKEERSKGGRHRPNDTEAMKSAKQALEVSAFRLLASQTTVERHQNPHGHAVIGASASNAAALTLSGARSDDMGEAAGDRKLSWFDGLIDRGRRKVRALFNVENARDVSKASVELTQAKLDAGMTAQAITSDNLSQMNALTGHEAQALARETAMYRWSTGGDQPIDRTDGRDIANAHLTRQSAHDLMLVAINGNLNPAEVQGHLLEFQQAFDTGRKLGRLRRGHSINIAADDALHIRKAINTVKMLDQPKTEADEAYWEIAAGRSAAV